MRKRGMRPVCTIVGGAGMRMIVEDPRSALLTEYTMQVQQQGEIGPLFLGTAAKT